MPRYWLLRLNRGVKAPPPPPPTKHGMNCLPPPSPLLLSSGSTDTRFDTLAILLLIPVVDQGVYPWMRRMGCEPTMLRKIGMGLLFAGAAVLAAAAVEVARRSSVLEGDEAIMSPCRR